jgi:hypothetical protein
MRMLAGHNRRQGPATNTDSFLSPLQVPGWVPSLRGCSGTDSDHGVLAVHGTLDRLAADESMVPDHVSCPSTADEPCAKRPQTSGSPHDTRATGGPPRGPGWRLAHRAVKTNFGINCAFRWPIRRSWDDPPHRGLP